MVASQIKVGWTEAALIAGAREVRLSPSIIGSFPRKEAALVEVLCVLYLYSLSTLSIPFVFNLNISGH